MELSAITGVIMSLRYIVRSMLADPTRQSRCDMRKLNGRVLVDIYAKGLSKLETYLIGLQFQTGANMVRGGIWEYENDKYRIWWD